MATIIQSITAEDLLRMPDDGFRYELVRGELRKMSPSGHTHGKIAMRISVPLGNYVWKKKLGEIYAAETGFKLASNPDTVRAPDVAFVRQERVKKAENIQGFWPGAPDLAVEVISPGDSYSEVDEKVCEWLDAGTRMVVVVDPRNRSVTVYRSRDDITILSETDTLDGGDVVPGWNLRVKNIFS